MAIAAQTIALLTQATSAGLALSGGANALDAHMLIGGAIFVISAVQVVLAFPLQRSERAPPWLIAASIGLLTAAIGLQMASGRLQLFAVHLPLGASLFGMSLALAIWAWTSRPGQTTSQASAHDAALTGGGLKLEEKP